MLTSFSIWYDWRYCYDLNESVTKNEVFLLNIYIFPISVIPLISYLWFLKFIRCEGATFYPLLFFTCLWDFVMIPTVSGWGFTYSCNISFKHILLYHIRIVPITAYLYSYYFLINIYVNSLKLVIYMSFFQLSEYTGGFSSFLSKFPFLLQVILCHLKALLNIFSRITYIPK